MFWNDLRNYFKYTVAITLININALPFVIIETANKTVVMYMLWLYM